MTASLQKTNAVNDKYPRIRFACVCGLRFNVPRQWANQVVRCKSCDKTLRVPTHDELQAT